MRYKTSKKRVVLQTRRLKFLRPLHNKKFCSFSRRAKILTAGILEVFRGLKFDHNGENGENRKLFKGL